MNMIIAFVFLVVFIFIVGFIEALKWKPDQEDQDSTPEIIIGQKVPDPFEAFKKDK